MRSQGGFGDIGEVTVGARGMRGGHRNTGGHRSGHGDMGVGVEMEHWGGWGNIESTHNVTWGDAQ